jgi:hypothetical protein
LRIILQDSSGEYINLHCEDRGLGQRKEGNIISKLSIKTKNNIINSNDTNIQISLSYEIFDSAIMQDKIVNFVIVNSYFSKSKCPSALKKR